MRTAWIPLVAIAMLLPRQVYAGPVSNTAQQARVEQLGAILDGYDREHFEKSLTELVQVAIDRNLRLGSIYRMNDEDLRLSSKGEKTARMAWALYGVFISGIDLPARYRAVTHSPTWLLVTTNGEVILEGVRSPRDFIDAQGNFRSKLTNDRSVYVEE